MSLPESLLRAPLSDIDLTVTHGTWPEGVHGEMFISAPVIDDRLSYQLFGFGAMVRVSMQAGSHGAAPDRFALRSQVIDTPVQRLHERMPEAFRGGMLGLESPFGHANMVNTAPLGWDGRLFATWDVGRPVEVDPVSLRFLGEVGSTASWGGDSFGAKKPLPQVFSTAHPVVDPQRGCLWSVKLVLGKAGMEPQVVRYDGNGASVRTWSLPGATVIGSMHTIAQTEHWLVLADSGNFKADMGEIMGGERTVMVDTTVPVYFVRKDEIDATPAGGELRYYSATFGPTTGPYYGRWDDADGIHVLFEHMDLTDLGYRLLADDVDAAGRPINPAHVGFYNMAMSSQTISEVTFTPGDEHGVRTASANDEWTWNLQLSAMDWSVEGMRTPTHHHVVFQGRRPSMLARRVLDVYRDRIGGPIDTADQRASVATFARDGLTVRGRYEFPSDGDLPSSPIFVPRQGGTPGGGDGWVIVPVLSDDGFRIECFDAADVAGGPVATLSGDQHQTMPFLLHAIWMPAATAAPDLERLRFADDLDEALLARLGDAERDAVMAVAAELG